MDPRLSGLLPCVYGTVFAPVEPADYGRVLKNTLSQSIFLLTGCISRVFLNVFHDVKLYRHEYLLEAILNRDKDRPVITVANHNSCLDDPVLTSFIVPNRTLVDTRFVRWAWCAREICFPNQAFSAFFRAAQGIPIDRGMGVHQSVRKI